MLLICESCHRHWHWRPCSISPQRRATCPKCHRQRVEKSWDRRRMRSRINGVIMERVSALEVREMAFDLEKLMGEVEAASARALQTAREVSKKF